jgi:hypothetical protein
MKKLICFLLIFNLLIFNLLFSNTKTLNNLKVSNEKESDFNLSQFILIGVDIVLGGLTVAALIQQSSLASDYEKLYNQINGTTEANYYRLLYEQEKVNAAADLVLISGITFGTFVTYTVLDYFILHNFFEKNQLKIGYDLLNNKLKISLNY